MDTLQFHNPTVWANGFKAVLTPENDPYTREGVLRRYGSGWHVRNPMGHWGVTPEIMIGSLNAMILGGTAPQGMLNVLAAVGHVPGTPLTKVMWADLFVLQYNAVTYMRAIFDAIIAAYPRETPDQGPVRLQVNEVQALLLAAGDPRALDPIKVRAVAEEYSTLPRQEAHEALARELLDTFGLTFPSVGTIRREVLETYDGIQSALKAAIGESDADQARRVAFCAEGFDRIEALLIDAAREGSAPTTGNLGLAAAYIRRARATTAVPADDPGKILDSLAKQDEAISDALKDPTPAFQGYLSSQPIIV